MYASWMTFEGAASLCLDRINNIYLPDQLGSVIHMIDVVAREPSSGTPTTWRKVTNAQVIGNVVNLLQYRDQLSVIEPKYQEKLIDTDDKDRREEGGIRMHALDFPYDSCLRLCTLIPECTAIQVACSGINGVYDCNTATPPAVCYFKSAVFPNVVFHLDRVPGENTTINYTVSSVPLQWPQSKVVTEEHVGDRHEPGSLVFDECSRACYEQEGCQGFMWPGCWRLKERITEADVPDEDSIPNFVDVLVERDHSVRHIGGIPGAYAFSGDNGDRSLSAVFNNPSHCAVDNHGQLYVSDTRNHRIRRIDRLTTQCQYLGDLFTDAQRQDYMTKMTAMEEVCTPLFGFGAAMDLAIREHDPSGLRPLLCLNQTERSLTVNVPQGEAVAGREALTRRAQCAHAMKQVMMTRVYMYCPYDNAMADTWHRVVTAYMECWVQEATMNELTRRTAESLVRSGKIFRSDVRQCLEQDFAEGCEVLPTAGGGAEL